MAAAATFREKCSPQCSLLGLRRRWPSFSPCPPISCLACAGPPTEARAWRVCVCRLGNRADGRLEVGPQGQTTESCREHISQTPLIICGTRRWLSKLRALQKHSGDFSLTSGVLSISGKVHSSSPCLLLSNRRTPGNHKRRSTVHLLGGRHTSKPLIIASPDAGSWVRRGPGPGSSKGRSGPLGLGRQGAQEPVPLTGGRLSPHKQEQREWGGGTPTNTPILPIPQAPQCALCPLQWGPLEHPDPSHHPLRQPGAQGVCIIETQRENPHSAGEKAWGLRPLVWGSFQPHCEAHTQDRHLSKHWCEGRTHPLTHNEKYTHFTSKGSSTRSLER